MGKGLQQTLGPTREADSCQSPKLDQDFLADHNCDHSADSSYERLLVRCAKSVIRRGGSQFADGQSSESASRDSASGCNSCMDPRMILPMTTACV